MLHAHIIIDVNPLNMTEARGMPADVSPVAGCIFGGAENRAGGRATLELLCKNSSAW